MKALELSTEEQKKLLKVSQKIHPVSVYVALESDLHYAYAKCAFVLPGELWESRRSMC